MIFERIAHLTLEASQYLGLDMTMGEMREKGGIVRVSTWKGEQSLNEAQRYMDILVIETGKSGWQMGTTGYPPIQEGEIRSREIISSRHINSIQAELSID